MMAKRRRRSKKWISWLLGLILLIAAGVVIYLVWDSYFNEEKVIKREGTEVVEAERVEKEQEEEQKEVKNTEEKKEVILYEGGDPNEAEELSGVVTYAGVSGDNLMIRVNIDQYLSEGSCNLILTKDGVATYGDAAAIVSSAATATCEGFNVPVSGIGSGNYEIVIKLNSGGKVGTINGEVNI